ncbi:AAA family ATPase [Ilumatobacter sp.]|uniref:AAA family ATPase n=1 Tax=Ilumatobacter sp. TaxID=1967498 RepID=UPI003B52F0A0
MELSPFPHHGPLEPGRVPPRAELVDDLVERVTERRVTALLGPRRYGKTTALRAVAARLGDAVTTVWLDLYELSSWADLAIRLDGALDVAGASGAAPLRELAAGFELRLGVLGVEFRRPAAQRPDPMVMVRTQFELLVEASGRDEVVLIVDEFSGIVGVDGASALMRTALQHEFQRIGLLFAGSEPSVMEMLFTDRAEPFYAQADLVEARPLDTAAVERLLRDGFSRTDRRSGGIAGRLHAATAGHPHRTMQLADAIWRRVPSGGEASIADFVAALDDVVAASSSGMERLFSSLPSGEQVVLRLVASGDGIFGAMASSLGLSNGGAQHARASLVNRGHLVRTDGILRVVDPILSEWLRRTFG